MANEEQVKRLKKGVEGWNKWRDKNLDVEINLVEADLRRADLRDADLRWADLEGADLRGADLRGAQLMGAKLVVTKLIKANLKGAALHRANLQGANLNRANLREAYLWLADLDDAHLRGSNLTGVLLGPTFLGNVDLSDTKGLEEVLHEFPSHISTSTLQRSKGKIPEKFLRGCGLSNWEIESAKLYQPGLSAQEVDNILYRVQDLRVGQAVQINPLFISYSHKDGAFVDEIEKHLDKSGIRFWRDIHDATAGRLEKVVDRAVRQNQIMLLILSENSVKSDWVEHEARTARELEKELERDVLCPVALDDAWKDCRWPERLREQIMEYHILDFSKWKEKEEFARMFRKLVDGLDLFYKEK